MIVPIICISSTNKRLDRAGLSLYDFGARWYNPVTPTWTTPDPMAEKYYGISPYAYCAGDPVNLVDPDGKDIYVFDSSGNYKENSKIKKDGTHQLAVHSKKITEGGQEYDHYELYSFADPINDASSIDQGIINHIVFVSLFERAYSMLPNTT